MSDPVNAKELEDALEWAETLGGHSIIEIRIKILAEEIRRQRKELAGCLYGALPRMSERQKALAALHGTPSQFASACYAAVPGDISMDEAAAAIEKYNREWSDASDPKMTPAEICPTCQGRKMIIPMGYQGEAVDCPTCSPKVIMTPAEIQKEPYDSRQDTLDHILRVRELLYIVQGKLDARGFAHDQSKLQEPEKYIFDTCTAKLKEMAYGSPEYKSALLDLKPALDHHYAHNSHHPEHYTEGVDGMTLLDVLEMLIDWKAATERMKDGGDIRRSLEINRERFGISPQLRNILANTIHEMGW